MTMSRVDLKGIFRLVSALAACTFVACSVPYVELAGRACPCVEGWTCDPVTDRCVTSAPEDSTRDARTPNDEKNEDAGPDQGDGGTAYKDSDAGTAPCADDFLDFDGDEVRDCRDACPLDALKTEPGMCGCGVAETDSDADGVPSCVDACPQDRSKVDPGVCGCGVADADPDGDGAPSCIDACSADRDKLDPGTCGCGVPDADDDMDGTLNCEESCPLDPHKRAPGVCGCGQSDGDSDGDGSADCDDACPNYRADLATDPCACRAPEQACSALPGLRRRHYTGGWERLPDFDALTPDAETIVSGIGLGEYDGGQEFGLLFTGYLFVDVAGSYELELASDDGSRLYIDGAMVVDLDAKHGLIARTVSLQLAAGLHPLRLEYFEAAGGEDLSLRYRHGNAELAPLPSSALMWAE
jgi:hypothetical protein